MRIPRDRDVEQTLWNLGGVADARELRRAGHSRDRVRAALARGAIARPARGVFALPHADPADIAAAVMRGQVTCVTALRRLGVPVMSSDDRMHLLVEGHRATGGRHRKPSARMTVHYVAERQSETPTVISALDVSSLCLPFKAQLAAVDGALQRGLLLPGDLDALTITSVTRVKRLQRLHDGRAQSPLETLTRLALVEAGLAVESQVELPGVGRVDLLVAGRVVVELDGREYHSDRQAFAEDRRRDRAAQLGDLTVLRYTYDDVMHRMATIVDEVRRALHRTLL